MIEDIGRVVSIKGDKAMVEVEPIFILFLFRKKAEKKEYTPVVVEIIKDNA